ncbi:hypothetical protein Tco_0576238 [Tanacetum coccineum]
MSDSEDSTVTYTAVSSPFGVLSDIGSTGVVRPEHEGLPWMLYDPYVQVALQVPPSPDYIFGPEEPQSPPPPDFIPDPIYPEFMLQEDEVFPAKEQPLPAATSPTAQSLDYVLESDPEEDPKEDDDEDPKEALDDKDDDVDIEADNDEEEDEHPAPADSTAVALPAADQAPSAEETEPFETNESTATPPLHPPYRVTARISIPALVPTPVWSDAEVAKLLAISTPPSSPLSPWSSPLPQIPSPPLPPILSPLPVSPPLPQIPSPPLPVSLQVLVLSPSPPASPIHPLGYQAAMIRLRAKAISTSHSLPLPPPIILSHTRPDAPLSTDRREDIPEVTLPPRKRLGIALGPRYEVGESSFAVAGRSMDASDLARAEVMLLRTTVLAQQLEIRELQSTDRRRQTVITEMLAADHKRQVQLTKVLKLVKRLQTQMAELQRQQGPAKGPAQPELPEEAGSSS